MNQVAFHWEKLDPGAECRAANGHHVRPAGRPAVDDGSFVTSPGERRSLKGDKMRYSRGVLWQTDVVMCHPSLENVKKLGGERTETARAGSLPPDEQFENNYMDPCDPWGAPRDCSDFQRITGRFEPELGTGKGDCVTGSEEANKVDLFGCHSGRTFRRGDSFDDECFVSTDEMSEIMITINTRSAW